MVRMKKTLLVFLIVVSITLSGCASKGPDPTDSHSGGYCLNKGTKFSQMGIKPDWPSCENFCAELVDSQNAVYENNKNWDYGFKYIGGAGYCYCTLCS